MFIIFLRIIMFRTIHLWFYFRCIGQIFTLWFLWRIFLIIIIFLRIKMSRMIHCRLLYSAIDSLWRVSWIRNLWCRDSFWYRSWINNIWSLYRFLGLRWCSYIWSRCNFWCLRWIIIIWRQKNFYSLSWIRIVWRLCRIFLIFIFSLRIMIPSMILCWLQHSTISRLWSWSCVCSLWDL
jgi:hypothetical protein